MRAFLSERMEMETALEKGMNSHLTTRFLLGLRCKLLSLQIKLSKYLNNEGGRLFW